MSNEPKYAEEKFSCPHCKAITQQKWINNKLIPPDIVEIYQQTYLTYRGGIRDYQQEAIENFLKKSATSLSQNFLKYLPNTLTISECQSCHNYTLWVDKTIVYPRSIPVEAPNSDMEQDIQDLYNEAALILIDSPKGATALLRLALQRLLEQLGEKGKINDSIGNLVKKGLNSKIQQALDFVRVVGNNAVHPGEINLDDNKDIALSLFKIINIIAQDMITNPKEIKDLYDSLVPEGAKEAIEKRDSK